MTGSEARRDASAIQTNLERLLNWAGSRYTPMEKVQLDAIRRDVEENLRRLASKAATMETTPLLLAVTQDGEGVRTVVIDMRDGTTRTFQTMVDFLDAAVGDHELEASRTQLREQQLETDRAERRARLLEGEVERLKSIDIELARVRGDLAAQMRLAVSESDRVRVEALETERVREERDAWRAKFHSAERIINETIPTLTRWLTSTSPADQEPTPPAPKRIRR
jgi:hypothetical protein